MEGLTKLLGALFPWFSNVSRFETHRDISIVIQHCCIGMSLKSIRQLVVCQCQTPLTDVEAANTTDEPRYSDS